jgi:hypothetical protein
MARARLRLFLRDGWLGRSEFALLDLVEEHDGIRLAPHRLGHLYTGSEAGAPYSLFKSVAKMEE